MRDTQEVEWFRFKYEELYFASYGLQQFLVDGYVALMAQGRLKGL